MYGDHWSEPARCGRCGQERSTHDDGYCSGVVRSCAQPAARRTESPVLTHDQAVEVMRSRGWDSIKLLGRTWVVGPSLDGIIHGIGQGRTLPDAVQNALDAERGDI